MNEQVKINYEGRLQLLLKNHQISTEQNLNQEFQYELGCWLDGVFFHAFYLNDLPGLEIVHKSKLYHNTSKQNRDTWA